MKKNVRLYEEFEPLKMEKYKDKVMYEPGLAKSVTFGESRQSPVHNWFYYKQGFSPPLVEYCINDSGLGKGRTVLDPFCGVGTTLLVANSMGYNSIGCDILPLATFVSAVKLRKDYDVDAIERASNQIIQTPYEKPTTAWPQVRVIERAFDKEIKDEILVFKERIMSIKDEATKNLLLLVLLSVIGRVSKTRKDGGFLRIVRDKPLPELREVFVDKANEILDDLKQQRFSESHDVNCEISIGDARSLDVSDSSIDCVITSPPYLNKTDYTRVYSLELCLSFVNSFEELRDIRYNSFRSHVEARYPDVKFTLPKSALEPLGELRKRKLSNPKHPDMIKGYFEDLYLSLQEVKRVLRKSSKAYFVLWNSRFSGINFNVDIILADISESIGLDVEEIIVTRQKGTSAQQNRKYGEEPLRESIIVLGKR